MRTSEFSKKKECLTSHGLTHMIMLLTTQKALLNATLSNFNDEYPIVLATVASSHGIRGCNFSNSFKWFRTSNNIRI